MIRRRTGYCIFFQEPVKDKPPAAVAVSTVILAVPPARDLSAIMVRTVPGTASVSDGSGNMLGAVH